MKGLMRLTHHFVEVWPPSPFAINWNANKSCKVLSLVYVVVVVIESCNACQLIVPPGMGLLTEIPRSVSKSSIVLWVMLGLCFGWV